MSIDSVQIKDSRALFVLKKKKKTFIIVNLLFYFQHAQSAF